MGSSFRAVHLLTTTLAVLLFAAAPAAGQDAAAQPPIDLRPQWEQGQAARYEIWSQREVLTTIEVGTRTGSGREVIETTGEATWQVDEVNADGSTAATMTLDWLRLRLVQEGNEQVVDSRRGGDSEAMQQLVEAMAGVPFEVELAPDGTVEAVRGVEAVRNQLPTEEMAPAELDFIEIASELAPLIHAPAEAEPGDTWSAELKRTSPLGWVYHDVTWRLAGVERIAGIPVATVVGQAKLTFEPDWSKIPSGGPELDLQMLSGETSTQVMFDLQRHEVVGRHAKQQSALEVDVDLPGQVFRRRMDETVQTQVLRLSEGE
ncbi:MAG: DUF6263 family protein [Phycisphaeraceae bacterium]